MGLPITLAAVVLITILVLAFFNRATLNRRISFSSANQIKAQMLAQSSLDLIVGQLRQQIADGSTSGTAYTQNGVTVYSPKDSTCLLPRKQPGINADTVGTATILYHSAHGATLNPLAASPLQLGSEVTIDTPSLNGRTQDHWFTEGPQLGSLQGGTLPTWVFLTQGNGIAASPATTAKPADADYVIGRFAYTVYDISGLLNANVAGYPAVMDSDANAYPAFKSSQAYADLMTVTGSGTTGNSLTAWRNPADNSSAAAYDAYLRDYGLKYGFLQTRAGDNAFLSRRDLLNAAANDIAGLNASSPGYLTAFARAVNAPSWSPTRNASDIQSGGNASYPYKNNVETASSANRNIPNVRFEFDDSNVHTMTHYRDDGTSFSYSVQAGAPLIQYRFSLAKLAWLTPTGPKAGISDEAIQACFGLKWIGGATEHWEYVGHTGSALQTSIKTLGQIAADIQNGRTSEPNFFELLKAGILCGSVGTFSQEPALTGEKESPTSQIVIEKNPDLQILKIGANMIDCAANDNYPTVIAFLDSGFEIAGQADLPYFYSMQMYMPRQSNPSGKDAEDRLVACDFCWTPVFFNPNRQVDSLAVPLDDAHTPAAIQANFGSGILTKLTSVGTKIASSPFACASNIAIDLRELRTISIQRSQYESFRASPQPATGAVTDADSFGFQVPYATADQNVKTFRVYSFQNEGGDDGWQNYSKPYASQAIDPTGSPVAQIQVWPTFQDVLLRLQYKTPNGNWKTYTTLGGQENQSGMNSQAYQSTGENDTKNNVLQCGPIFSQKNITVLNGGAGSYKFGPLISNFDPRTNRLGPCSSHGACTLPALSSLSPTSPAGLMVGISQYEPYFLGRSSVDTYKTLFGLWPQGGKGYDQLGTSSAPASYGSANGVLPVFNYPDPDGVFRPADGWLESSVDSTNTTNLYTPSNVGKGASSARSILLHRPFRSVAELGYVFRDNAWKSLSFFDATSGDGALLDLFSVADQPSITAGRVNLNTRQTLVQQALLSKVSCEPDGSSRLTQSTGTSLSAAYQSYAYSSGTATASLPGNPAQLANFMSDQSTQITAAGLDKIKYHRESVVRALSETTQTRTWNLLIDVVAQTGRYPSNALTAPSAAKFVVEGEKRYWLSIAIDRFTGKVIDQQLEPATH